MNGLKIASDMFKNQAALQMVGDDTFWAKGTASLTNNPIELLSGCSGLKTLGNMDFTAVPSTVNLNSIFSGCTSLSDVLGFKTLDDKPSLSHNISFSDCPLTHDSLMNITDSLKTLDETTTKALTLGTTNLTILSDVEKLVIINKYWTLPGWDISFDSKTAEDLIQYLYGNEETAASTEHETTEAYIVSLYNINTTGTIDWYIVNKQTGLVSEY